MDLTGILNGDERTAHIERVLARMEPDDAAAVRRLARRIERHGLADRRLRGVGEQGALELLHQLGLWLALETARRCDSTIDK